MGDPRMALAESDLVRIGEYVKGNLRDWMEEIDPPRRDPVTNTMLLERVVNVEHELKAQRELMDVRFQYMEKRFEAMDARFAEAREHSDQRFEAMDARFAEAREHSDQRFEAMDARFSDLVHHTDKRFSLLTWLIGITIAGVGTTIAMLAL